MRTPRFPLLGLCGLFGCSSFMAEDDGRAFGDDLGKFDVAATLKAQSCGAGALQALGAPDPWEFSIFLSRRDPEFYWNTGAAAVEGRIASDGRTISWESQTVVEVDPELTLGLPCVLLREDRGSGVLDDAGAEVDSLDGSLVYSFAEAPDTDCSAIVGIPTGFAQLPCEIRYAFEARHVDQ